MDQIEISINLSMSGASFQPSTTAVCPSQQQLQQQQQQQLQSGPKIIPHSGNYFGNNSVSSASTTPTDLMECSTLNVY
jgi:hypothetical protein